MSGRFISSDPLGLAGGDANQYRHAGNQPTGFTDPLGLFCGSGGFGGAGGNMPLPCGHPLSGVGGLGGLGAGSGGLGGAGGGSGNGNGSDGGGGNENWDENWWDQLERGNYYGTGFGDEATDWWAEQYNNTGEWYNDPMWWYYGGGGLSASLWTSDTWTGTASALAGAGITQVVGIAGMGPWMGTVVRHGAHAGGPH